MRRWLVQGSICTGAEGWSLMTTSVGGGFTGRGTAMVT